MFSDRRRRKYAPHHPTAAPRTKAIQHFMISPIQKSTHKTTNVKRALATIHKIDFQPPSLE
jgi:hypothetical protein